MPEFDTRKVQPSVSCSTDRLLLETQPRRQIPAIGAAEPPSIEDLEKLGTPIYPARLSSRTMDPLTFYTSALLVLTLVVLVAGLWFSIEAFRVSFLWGLGVSLLPPVTIAFAYLYWQRVKIPAILGLAASVLYVWVFVKFLELTGINPTELYRQLQSLRAAVM